MPSKIELPFGLGARYKDDPKDYTYRHAERVMAAVDLDRPAKVDNRHLFAHVPVWNQGKEGACTGMAMAAVLSVVHGLELSPRMAFEVAKLHDEWPGEAYDGSSTRAACNGAVALGDCKHSLWPFVPFNPGGKHADADANGLLHRISRYERLSSVAEMLDAIWRIGYCVVTVNVHTGWIRLTKKHRIPYSSRYVSRGLHAVVLLGYDETAGYFLLRNSWRDDYGDGGHTWLKFDDWAANGYDAWVIFYEAEQPCPNGSG
jgi:hypothetical protein